MTSSWTCFGTSFCLIGVVQQNGAGPFCLIGVVQENGAGPFQRLDEAGGVRDVAVFHEPMIPQALGGDVDAPDFARPDGTVQVPRRASRRVRHVAVQMAIPHVVVHRIWIAAEDRPVFQTFRWWTIGIRLTRSRTKTDRQPGRTATSYRNPALHTETHADTATAILNIVVNIVEARRIKPFNRRTGKTIDARQRLSYTCSWYVRLVPTPLRIRTPVIVANRIRQPGRRTATHPTRRTCACRRRRGARGSRSVHRPSRSPARGAAVHCRAAGGAVVALEGGRFFETS